MKLIYSPDGDDPQEFQFDIERMSSLDAEPLEEVGGAAWRTYEQWAELLSEGSFKAKKALLWVQLRKQNRSLRFSDLVVGFHEMTFDTEDDDREHAREMLKRGDLDDETRAKLEALAEDAPGKEEGGDSNTDSPSPEPVSDLSPSN